MENLTTSEALIGGAAVGGVLAATLIGALIFYIMIIIAWWKIFSKAGEKGWKSLIPIYNVYIIFKISGIKGWFWYNFIIVIACSIITGVAGGIQYNENFEIVGNPSMVAIIATLFSYIFSFIVTIYMNYKLAKAFNKGIGYTLGLILLPNIFTLILGFGSAKYNKKVLKA